MAYPRQIGPREHSATLSWRSRAQRAQSVDEQGMKAAEAAVGHDQDDVAGTDAFGYLLDESSHFMLGLRIDATGPKLCHQTRDIQLLAFRNPVMPSGNSKADSGRTLKGGRIRLLV